MLWYHTSRNNIFLIVGEYAVWSVTVRFALTFPSFLRKPLQTRGSKSILLFLESRSLNMPFWLFRHFPICAGGSAIKTDWRRTQQSWHQPRYYLSIGAISSLAPNSFNHLNVDDTLYPASSRITIDHIHSLSFAFRFLGLFAMLSSYQRFSGLP